MASKYHINRFVLLFCYLTYIVDKTRGENEQAPANSSLANECITPPNSLELIAGALQQMYTQLLELNFEAGMGNKIFRKSPYLSHFATLFQFNSCPFSYKDRWAVLTQRVKGSDKNMPELRSCPWHFEKKFDADRIPKMIYQAKCSCNQCVQSVRKHCEKDGTGCLRFSGSCVPIEVPFPVIRRTCAIREIFYKYIGDIEFISVGCTCKINEQL